ncbi:unnamed protein product [Amoebophrya sp. A120]|nr:unnamed protein product [Amoebophrya sp. A120]|eukprot:GSA120T00006545001.1
MVQTTKHMRAEPQLSPSAVAETKRWAADLQQHPRSLHCARIDYRTLADKYAYFKACLSGVERDAVEQTGELFLDYRSPECLAKLTKVLLEHFYDIRDWQAEPFFAARGHTRVPKARSTAAEDTAEIESSSAASCDKNRATLRHHEAPNEAPEVLACEDQDATYHLCPPVPRSANYLHYVADLFLFDSGQEAAASSSSRPALRSIQRLRGLDIGVGMSCIFPLLGEKIYEWDIIGSDISPETVEFVRKTYGKTVVLQKNPRRIFDVFRRERDADAAIIGPASTTGEIDARPKFAFCVCNPPFHENIAYFEQNKKKFQSQAYGGKPHEVVCEGGEVGFAFRMLQESKKRELDVLWYTIMVSRYSTKKKFEEWVAAACRVENEKSTKSRSAAIVQTRTFELKQGKSVKWVLCWSFHTQAEILACLEASRMNDVDASSEASGAPVSGWLSSFYSEKATTIKLKRGSEGKEKDEQAIISCHSKRQKIL